MNISKKSITSIFKPYLNVKDGYKGGKPIVAAKEGQKVYKLSSNENPVGTSPKAIDAIKKHLTNLHIYPDTTDIRLRESLVTYYDKQLNIDQFLCAASGSELIDILIRGFIREEDEVIISTPCFVPYRMFSQWSGAKVVDVPLTDKEYELDVNGILKAINSKTRIVFLTSPNNPTGTYIPKVTLENLIKEIPSNIIVVFDEVYWHFADAPDYVKAINYLEKYPNIIAINSFSKTYGLAALRVGYAYTSIEIANYLRQICKPFLISKLSLEGAIAALKDTTFIAETIRVVKTERKFIQNEFDKLNINYTPSQANFFLLDPPINDIKFTELMRNEGIAVRPVKNFGAAGKVRISIGNREANKAMLHALARILGKLTN